MKKLWKFFDKYTTPLLVLLSFSICCAFTIICLILSNKGLTVSDTLVEWVFKFFGLELLALSGIKISKHIGSAFGNVEQEIEELKEIVDGNVDEDGEY